MNDESEANRRRFLLQYGSASKMKEILSMPHVEHRAKAARLGLALKNPACDHEIVDMAYHHDGFLRIKSASHPAISKETHEKALTFSNPDVQEAALNNPKTTDEHLRERATNSVYSYIRDMASEHLQLLGHEPPPRVRARDIAAKYGKTK